MYEDLRSMPKRFDSARISDAGMEDLLQQEVRDRGRLGRDADLKTSSAEKEIDPTNSSANPGRSSP